MTADKGNRARGQRPAAVRYVEIHHPHGLFAMELLVIHVSQLARDSVNGKQLLGDLCARFQPGFNSVTCGQ